MNRLGCLIVFVMLFVVGCGAQPGPEPTAMPLPPATVEATEPPFIPTQPPEPTAERATSVQSPVPADHPGLPLPADRGDLFAASGLCAACHTQMVDGTGKDVSIDTAWRASMMANAARDPYWQASVRGEVLSNPDYQEVIEDKCATCHMPMARTTTMVQGTQGAVLDAGLTSPDHALHNLAMDGVSCTVCHQIRQDGFGQHEGFSGHYTIDAKLPPGEREAFGPFQAGRNLVQIMQAGSGFIPVQSTHIQQSEMCASCHNLYTPYLDAAGEIAGEFPEQTPHLEWAASTFSGSTSCQGCHMPPAQGAVRLSITGGPPRSPVLQHMAVGGNAYIAQMFESFGDEMGTTASSQQFRNTQAQVLEQLQSRTASLSLQNLTIDASSLTVEVAVSSMTGHKFPTSFPSRRAWLQVTVADAGGNMLFESGRPNPDGSIAGNDNDADPTAYEPHYQTINSPDQVQIYEAIMGNTEGEVTTTLLRGAQYLKDNRILPAGFDKASVHPDIAVYGTALQDVDFVGGGDIVQYVINVGDAQGPFAVTVTLLYQPIGFRWADNLRAHNAPEPARFVTYYEQVANEPVVVTSANSQIGE